MEKTNGTEKQSEALSDRVLYFARFLRAGGTFSLSDWRGILEASDRAAAAAAGDLVSAERAALVAREIVTILTPPTPDPMEAAGLRALGVTA